MNLLLISWFFLHLDLIAIERPLSGASHTKNWHLTNFSQLILIINWATVNTLMMIKVYFGVVLDELSILYDFNHGNFSYIRVDLIRFYEHLLLSEGFIVLSSAGGFVSATSTSRLLTQRMLTQRILLTQPNLMTQNLLIKFRNLIFIQFDFNFHHLLTITISMSIQ